MHSAKQRGKTRSRILYWFRTPPSVRVGRAALDEEAIRLIEEHNPDVEFDWTRILKGQEAADARPKPEPERRPQRPARERREAPRAAAPEPKPAPPQPRAAAPTEVPAPVAPPEPELPEFPLTLPPDEPASAALSRLGPEGLLRLRARHAEVLARISEKITDPARCDELKTQAERLNPDTWVTDAEVSAGLEQYEAVFESLRSVVGRRRKRRKRRGGSGAEQPQAPAVDAAEPDDDGE